MTAFSPANIPPTVSTLEELLVWSASALSELNGTKTIQTSAGQIEKAVQCQTFEFRNEATSPQRCVVVAYLPLTAGWRSAGKLFAEGIAELSTTALPATYTT